MEFYTSILRQSAGSWVALCLENGLVGQGVTQEDTIRKLKDAIDSFEAVYETENNIYKAPVSIEELHEFLTVEDKEQNSDGSQIALKLEVWGYTNKARLCELRIL